VDRGQLSAVGPLAFRSAFVDARAPVDTPQITLSVITDASHCFAAAAGIGSCVHSKSTCVFVMVPASVA